MIDSMSMPFLDVRDVRKSYGRQEALRGVSFTVEAGELFGLLGPNGAGKTTLLSIIACLSDPSAGQVFLDGKPLKRDDLAVRGIIGIGTQDLSVYAELSARENLAFFGKLYGLTGADLAKRIDEVLELIALRDRADDRAGTFSGGMKRRLNLGVAIIHRPRLLLLDEPTTGIDPQSRNHIFERVRDLSAKGVTVIYTSHYMEEVQALCPRIAIIDHGKSIACDAVQHLLRLIKGSVRLKLKGDPQAFPELRADGDWFVIESQEPRQALVKFMNQLRGSDLIVEDVQLHESTLEQVFLHLTEKTVRD